VTSAAISVRALGALSAGLLALGMLAACTPEPKPAPTPTKTALFSSDAEAFKAAEETYRAYTDALNNVDTSDPKTWEPATRWTVGRASSALKKSLSELQAEEVQLTGNTVIITAAPIKADLETGKVSVHICADVSQTDVIDSTGNSLVPSDRSPVQSVRAEFVEADSETGLRLASTTAESTLQCSH